MPNAIFTLLQNFIWFLLHFRHWNGLSWSNICLNFKYLQIIHLEVCSTLLQNHRNIFVNQIYLSPKEELWKKTLCTAKLKYLLKIKHIPSYFIQIWLHLPIHWAHSFKRSDFFYLQSVLFTIFLFLPGKKTMHVKRC